MPQNVGVAKVGGTDNDCIVAAIAEELEPTDVDVKEANRMA